MYATNHFQFNSEDSVGCLLPTKLLIYIIIMTSARKMLLFPNIMSNCVCIPAQIFPFISTLSVILLTQDLQNVVLEAAWLQLACTVLCQQLPIRKLNGNINITTRDFGRSFSVAIS